MPAGSDILDPDGNDVTAAKLTVDRQVEHGKIAGAAFDPVLRSNRSDEFSRSGWLSLPYSMAFLSGG